MLPVCTCALADTANPSASRKTETPANVFRNFLIIPPVEVRRGILPIRNAVICNRALYQNARLRLQAVSIFMSADGVRASKSWIIAPERSMNSRTLLGVSAALIATALTGLPGHAASQSAAPPKSSLTIEQLIDIKHPSNPMWSPDGRSVLFVWDRAGVSSVFVADADPSTRSGQTALAPRELKEAGGSLGGAFWSADGRALMMSRSGDLWRVPIDGSAASAVWTTPQPEFNIVPSPDGAKVAFVRNASNSQPQEGGQRGRGGLGGGGAGASTELWVRTLADGKESRVLAQPGIGGVGWSPDGQNLIFTSGGSAIRHEQTPAYSGAKIIYTINENVPGQTFVVPATGGTATPLAAGGGFGGGRPGAGSRHFGL